jgi:hypothetical protein
MDVNLIGVMGELAPLRIVSEHHIVVKTGVACPAHQRGA